MMVVLLNIKYTAILVEVTQVAPMKLVVSGDGAFNPSGIR